VYTHTHTHQQGYPDFVEVDDKLLYVESNKLVVRFHRVDPRTLQFLTLQDTLKMRPKDTPSLCIDRVVPGVTTRGPVCPEFRSRSGGCSFCVWFQANHKVVRPRQVLVSALSCVTATLDEKDQGRFITKGYSIYVVGDGKEGLQLEMKIRDGFDAEFTIRTDTCGRNVDLFDGRPHLVTFVVDSAPAVCYVVVDRWLADGGISRPQGWGRVPGNIEDVGGQDVTIQPEPTVRLPFPPFPGKVLRFEMFDRPLLTSEAIAYSRYGFHE